MADGAIRVRADIIEQMRAEEADLLRKLQAVRDFLAAYGEKPLESSRSSYSTDNQNSSTHASSREKVTIEGYTDYGKRVVATAMAKLMTSPYPIRTRQILEYVNAMGIEVTGKEPVNALGALLYRSADVVSHGKSGWTLDNPDAAHEIVSKYAQSKSAPQDDFSDIPGAGSSRGGEISTAEGLDQPIVAQASTS